VQQSSQTCPSGPARSNVCSRCARRARFQTRFGALFTGGPITSSVVVDDQDQQRYSANRNHCVLIAPKFTIAPSHTRHNLVYSRCSPPMGSATRCGSATTRASADDSTAARPSFTFYGNDRSSTNSLKPTLECLLVRVLPPLCSHSSILLRRTSCEAAGVFTVIVRRAAGPGAYAGPPGHHSVPALIAQKPHV
jgi:hypothetical protein